MRISDWSSDVCSSDLAGGWLTAARACPSPNCDARPDEDDISLLVIHNISLPPGQFGGAYIDQLFTNTLDATAHPYFAQIHTLRVSSHLLIDRRGRLTQYEIGRASCRERVGQYV